MNAVQLENNYYTVIEGYVKSFLRGEDAYFISYYINRNRDYSQA